MVLFIHGARTDLLCNCTPFGIAVFNSYMLESILRAIIVNNQRNCILYSMRFLLKLNRMNIRQLEKTFLSSQF